MSTQTMAKDKTTAQGPAAGGDVELEQELLRTTGLDGPRCRMPVDDLSTPALFQVARATLTCQREAIQDQLNYLRKLEDCLDQIAERVAKNGKSVRSQTPEIVRQERDLRAELTRRNADLKKQVATLQKKIERYKFQINRPHASPSPVSSPQPSESLPSDQNAPWKSYVSRTGRGGGFGCGLPPYGYRWDRGELEPIPYEQQVLAMVAQLRRDDERITWTAVAHDLNQEKYRTRRGNPFTGLGIKRIYDKHLERQADLQVRAIATPSGNHTT